MKNITANMKNLVERSSRSDANEEDANEMKVPKKVLELNRVEMVKSKLRDIKHGIKRSTERRAGAGGGGGGRRVLGREAMLEVGLIAFSEGGRGRVVSSDCQISGSELGREVSLIKMRIP